MKNLLPDLKHYNLVLASASPRRQELLKEMGFDFEIRLKGVEENYPPDLKGAEIAEYLAKLKSDAFQNELAENEILITGDTIVSLDNQALGKPKDETEAKEMLQSLSGRSHEVISSVCLRTSEKCVVFHDSTTVFFKNLSEKEIEFYISNFKPFDKAGAYGIQEWIGMIGVEKIDGSYFTVMGFPVHRFYAEIKKLIS
jgi:septum formation protein